MPCVDCVKGNAMLWKDHYILIKQVLNTLPPSTCQLHGSFLYVLKRHPHWLQSQKITATPSGTSFILLGNSVTCLLYLKISSAPDPASFLWLGDFLVSLTLYHFICTVVSYQPGLPSSSFRPQPEVMLCSYSLPTCGETANCTIPSAQHNLSIKLLFVGNLSS